MPGTSHEEIEAEVEALMAELFAMAARDPMPNTKHYAAFLMADKPRAHAIGQRLYEIGGHRLMLLAHDKISREAPLCSGRHLETAWDRVGDWRC